MVSFLSIQVWYYFLLFQGRVFRIIGFLRWIHTQDTLSVSPKAVMWAYDEFLLFLVYIFFIMLFSAVSFVAFDYAQRSKVMVRLRDGTTGELLTQPIIIPPHDSRRK
jgi:hypothetical protein